MAAIHDERMLNHLLRELEPYGIGVGRIEIAYQADLQDYDVLISGGELSLAEIEGVRQAVGLGGCVRFTDPSNTARWTEALRRDGQELLTARAVDLRQRRPDIPAFDRSAMSLEEFAKAVEIWAGLEPGATLKVVGEGSLIVNGQTTDRSSIAMLMEVVAVFAAEGIDVLLAGSDAP